MIHQVECFSSLNRNEKIIWIVEDYTPAFSRLAFAKKTPTDLFGSSITDARYHLAKCLHTLTSSHPNQVRSHLRFSHSKKLSSLIFF